MSSQIRLDKTHKVTDAYATTNTVTRVPGAIIDIRYFPISSVAFRIANTGVTNDISYKVRGSIDGVNFTDVITKTLAGADQAATGAVVQENSAAEVFIDRNYADRDPVLSFGFFDVTAESTIDDTPSTVVVTISAH